MTDQLNLSFSAEEILAAGVDIEIHPPRLVDQKSARSAIVLQKDGQTVAAPITVDQNSLTVRLATSHLEPGTYRLQIQELYDARKEKLVDHQVTSFRIGALKGKVTSELRVEHATYVALGDLELKRLLPTENPPEGFKYVEFVKAVERKSNRPVALTFDESGNSIDGNSLLADLQRRQHAKYGCLDKVLFQHISSIKPSDQVDVVVWPQLKIDLTGYEKPNSGEIREPPDAARRLLEQALQRRSAAVSRLREVGAHVKETPEKLPFAYASVKAGDFPKLAKSNDIGKVFRDDRSAKADLADSLAISRANQAQALGFTGSGVHVAIFEQGPSDLTNLVFDGRYLSSPAASTHARLTSAIIKNVEPGKPHGYAPNCSLYSANSYDNAALQWAVASPQTCTVISQSFHRNDEETSDVLSADDLLKDHLATQYPFPTIVHAAGNITVTPEYVNHKGFNTISVGNHNDTATAMASDSVFKNPASPHGDRELPEIAANGTGVTAVGVSDSGTSFAAPAVAGTVALLQSVDGTLKSWPEGCRAILFASADRNVSGGTWTTDLGQRIDQSDGAGALNAQLAVMIAQIRGARDAPATVRSWDAASLQPSIFDASTRWAKFRYRVQVPQNLIQFPLWRYTVKVALAWDSKFVTSAAGVEGSTLTVDLDLVVLDSSGNQAAVSASNDNSYEIAEFVGTPGATYDIVVRHWSGDFDYLWYGIAWNVTSRAIIFSPLVPGLE